MLVASHNYDMTLEVSLIRSLLERRIDGIAIVGHHHLDSAIEMLNMRSIPVLALWGYHKDAVIPFVGSDNTQAAYKVTQHLLELGHNDIAFIFPDTHNNDRAKDRKAGALQAMRDAGKSVPDNRILTCPYNIAQSKQTTIDLLRKDKPTAIVCGNDVIAHGVIYGAQQEQITLPYDLSVVGIGDFTGSADIVPSLTTVRLPANRIGQIAADAIVEMSERGSAAGFKNRIIETELIVRESTSQVSR